MFEAGGSNIEIAQHLSDHKGSAHSLGHEILEIAEAMLLAVVAITTAWSGYQSALWAGHQSELYGQASKLRVQAALDWSYSPYIAAFFALRDSPEKDEKPEKRSIYVFCEKPEGFKTWGSSTPRIRSVGSYVQSDPPDISVSSLITLSAASLKNHGSLDPMMKFSIPGV